MVKFLRWGLGFLLFLSIIGGIALAAVYFYITPDLPEVSELKAVHYQVPMRVLTHDGALISEFGEKRRMPLAIEDVPERLKQAVIAAEDDRFYEHPGVDYMGLLRAAWSLALTGDRSQGGSTITMQVARNFFLTPERTYIRKLREIFLALKIEDELSKDEILALYLNQNFMGNRAYGVAAAARTYYGVDVRQLTLPQIAMLAGLYKAPSKFNPVVNPERAKTRRNYVLRRMRENGYITAEEANAAMQAELTARIYNPKPDVEAGHLAEMVRAWLYDQYGEEAYTRGLVVTTTIDSKLQQAANQAMRKALLGYSMRHGYRGPEAHHDLKPGKLDLKAADRLLEKYPRYAGLLPGLVVGVEKKQAKVYLGRQQLIDLPLSAVEWARAYKDEDTLGPKIKSVADVLKVGDIIRVRQAGKGWQLAQVPKVGGALVSISPQNGRLYAMVGGYDYFLSRFNRATQAVRQPGSGFKPFIYSAALESGFTPASIFNDAPVVFHDLNLDRYWRPKNYSGRFYGPTRMRVALAKSRNMVSIRILRRVGIEQTISHIRKFGMTQRELPRDLSLALGSGALTPIELVSGYAVFANGGYRVEPWFVEQVTDLDGKVLYRHVPDVVCRKNCDKLIPSFSPDTDLPADASFGKPAKRVLPETNAWQVVSMMQDVIRMGTATEARKLKRKDLAGKTGTTNDQIDAWFNGFTPDIVTTVWIGFDESKPLGRKEAGGKLALPAWMDYMKVALQQFPEREWKKPTGMITVHIDPETGLQTDPGAPGAVLETFRAGKAPEKGIAKLVPVEDADVPEQIF